MRSDRLVDPEIQYLLGQFGVVPQTVEALPAYRQALDTALASVPSTVLIVPPLGDAPALNLLSYRPADADDAVLPAILHIHGGGYVVGRAAMNHASNQRLATQLRCAIYSVEYRLAPENPHPGPLEDCYRALRWIQSNAERLSIKTSTIGVKGESAGGGLAAALSLLARDRGEIQIAFQHLIYPMLDDRTGTTAIPANPYAGEYVWTPQHNQFGWSCLLGNVNERTPARPFASAARATDLVGLPSAFIAVGALDLFLDENLEYARRLSHAGVPLELHVYPGAFHGFDAPPANSRVALAAEKISHDALRRALHG